MNHYLIKRNPDFTRFGVIDKKNTNNKIYSESIITNSNKNPISIVLKKDYKLWISESDWGIYASATVTKVKDSLTFNSIELLLEYIPKSENKNDNSYWMEKLVKFSSKLAKDSSYNFKYHEYFVDQRLLNINIPLTGKLERLSKPGLASSLIKLQNHEIEFLENPYYERNDFKISTKIPSSLKLDIYNFFNTNLAVQHFIDIDHFVPKSTGGPGNIIENLVPIGLNLNRYKSNSIPKGLFIESINHNDLKAFVKNKYLESNNIIYFTERTAIDDAIKINNIVLNWKDLNKIKEFYKKVMENHHPEYTKIIEEYNINKNNT